MTVDAASTNNPPAMRPLRVAEFMNQVVAKNPGELEFHQAVREVAESVMPFIDAHPVYRQAQDPRAAGGAGAGGHVPRALAGRSGRYPGQPRFSHPDEQRDRSVQRAACGSTRPSRSACSSSWPSSRSSRTP